MNAFISWSGHRELLIAKAVREWLAAVAPEIRTFISPDLPKGQTWFGALAKELEGAQIAFLCLAPPRVASEWQLVEAGAIWKAAGSGGLFPLCFGLRGADVPEPLRAFQLTQFDEEDFKRLARDVAKLTGAAQAQPSELEQALERSWSKLSTRVEAALSQPDDGVHTTRGFIHEIAGGWWERVRSDDTRVKLSWMWFKPSNDGTGQTISGRGFGEGSDVTQWKTELVSVNAQGPDPILEYYWEGRHSSESRLLFGGKCRVQFTISANGSIKQGTGEFRDVCMDEARPPTTKLIDLQRATLEEIAIMKDGDEKDRRALADQKLQTWP